MKIERLASTCVADFYRPGDAFTPDWFAQLDAWARELDVYLPPEPGTCVHCGRRVECVRTHGRFCGDVHYWSPAAEIRYHSSDRFFHREDYP